MVLLFQRKRHISLPRRCLLFGDLAIVLLAQLGALFVRFGWDDGLLYLAENGIAIGISVAVYLLVFYASGMYEPAWNRPARPFDFLPLGATLLATAISALIVFANPGMVLGRGIWLLASGFILAAVYALRALLRHLVRRGHFLKRALLLCDTPDAARELLDILRDGRPCPYRVDGIVPCGSLPATAFDGLRTAKPGAPSDAEPARPVPVAGALGDLDPDFLEAREISSILVAVDDPALAHNLLPRMRGLRYRGFEIQDRLSLTEELRREIPLAHLSEEWLMQSAMNCSVLSIRRTKRILDIAAALIGLVPGLPLMLLAGLLVKLTSRGPMVYRQTRVGLGGRPYTLYKLRTMRADAEASGAVWSASSDSRVTPVGYFLRKWRIDEIPQLFNILKGEMSLVGPRPERPEFTAVLEKAIPFYNERTLVPPGLTGWAQIWFPYASSVEAAARKLQFDLYYVKNMSVLLDATVLLRTFKTILVGLRHEDEFLLQGDERLETLLASLRGPGGAAPAPLSAAENGIDPGPRTP
ncbi:MAG: sugar transferase [Kiritimatiellae bacterium]|nr:sugar transferase [Kiritimatiellia bacterium]